MMEKSSSTADVMDGQDLIELVEDNKELDTFLDKELQQGEGHTTTTTTDSDTNKELQPVVVPLPTARSDFTKSDPIFTEVPSKCASTREKISKSESGEVFGDSPKGMASGLKQDPVVILRIDGEDLLEFVQSPTFETDMICIFSKINSTDESLKDFILKAFEKLTVDQGMPPALDSWVLSNILEPALESLGESLQKPASQETFLIEFKKAAEKAVQLLKEKPAIVAHSQHTFDGTGIKRLLSHKFGLNKLLDSALKGIPRDENGSISKEYVTAALNAMASTAGLPPFGIAVQMDLHRICLQMDCVLIEALEKNELLAENGAGDRKTLTEDEFKNLLKEILRSIMMHLESNPVSIFINTIVHDPAESSSTPQQP